MSLVGEALVATTGFLGGLRQVTEEDVRLAEALLTSVAARAAHFIQREKQRPFKMQPQRNVQGIRRSLQAVLTDTAKAEAINGIEPVLGADYLDTFEQARDIALACYPVTEIPAMNGSIDLDPPEDEQQEWLSILAVLEDVERLLEELEMFALTVTQVSRFRDVYPELHAFMASVFDEEMAERTNADPKWTLTEDKESALRVFKGMEAEELIRPLPPAIPTRPPPKADDLKNSDQTVGQASAFR